MAELAHAREQGIAVDVEGVPYEDQTPDEVWELMQKRNYMLDYEGDDTGRIVALHIELLKPLKKTSISYLFQLDLYWFYYVFYLFYWFLLLVFGSFFHLFCFLIKLYHRVIKL